jgi:purine-nucleoside/S-methyl-5'-thioadenosine phosphorylase / adenosine deaminase
MTPADGFRWASAPWGPILTLTAWSPQFRHFFTTRHLRFRGREEARDWARVADELGVGPGRLLRPGQVHGTSIAIKRLGDETGGWGAGRPRADIILTDDPTVAVAVQVADCVPVLIADWRTGVVAAVHAGWRGTAKRVVQVAVRALGETFRSRPSDLSAALGPAIGPCCYEVGPELLDVFAAAGHAAAERDRWFGRSEDGKVRLDVPLANRDQLLAAGLAPHAIHVAGLCTVSHPDLFYSYRREGQGTGRIVGVIKVKGA